MSRCMVTGCKGRIVATISESQANDTLRYLQGLFNVDKYLNELQLKQKKGDKENLNLKNIPHRAMLEEVSKHIDQMLDHSKYNKVDLSQIFSFMNVYN